jgi:polyamine oxidase
MAYCISQGDFSERIEALPDSQVEREVVGVLRSMYPNVRIPDPEAFYYQRWFSDPLYRGSYSNWPASFFSEHHDNLRATVDQRLWFAGEATSMKWFGQSF